MYRASIFQAQIKCIEVIKTTIHTVTYEWEGSIVTTKKVEEYAAWFHTREKAEQWLLSFYEKEIENAKKTIARSESLIKRTKEQQKIK